MSMYLPNQDVHAIGLEPAEFLDIPPMHEDPIDAPPLRGRRRPRIGVRLDDEDRSDITRWAEEYISSLVEHRNGDAEDVRAVVRRLNHELLVDRDGGR